MRTRDEQKEQLIRQKALEMIVHEGIDRFSIQKLAKAAGVSPATMYIYFENKEDLILQLYAQISKSMFDAALKGFDSSFSFEQGMRIQWYNRMDYALNNPLESLFLEQLKMSPVGDKALRMTDPHFKTVMEAFVKNAVRNKELVKIPLQVYWSIAFAPLYNLIRMHKSGRGKGGEKFELDKKTVDQALALVLKALKP